MTVEYPNAYAAGFIAFWATGCALSGKVRGVIGKILFASLPGAGYGQREHKLEDLLAHYKLAAGVLA